MIHLEDYIYEAELNLAWWNSKSPAYQKRYLNRHPNSIYAQKVKSGDLEVAGDNKPEDAEEKPVEKSKTPKADQKEEKLNKKIEDDQKALDALTTEWHAAFNAWKEIPIPSNMKWNSKTQDWEFENPEDRQQYLDKERLRAKVRQINAQIEVYRHRIELAKRGLLKLRRQKNFEERQATPNATDKYKEQGIAKIVDFSGMDAETEKEATDAVLNNIKRYPFMKDHLSFLGSHKSSKFRELSDQLAHDYYLDQVEKDYNKAKDYYEDHMKGYLGSIKRPSEAYNDKENWVSEEARDHLTWVKYAADEAYEKMQRIDSRGGPEGYIKTPAYQNAINRWKRMKSRNWAYYRPDYKNGESGLIAFNENSFDDADLKHNVDIKWHPEGCDSKKATMDHEFGHAIWFKLGLNKNGTPNVNGNDSFGRSPLQQYIAQEMYHTKDHIKNNLSEYAATNSSEFFAEAYSEYLNNPNPRPIAKKVGELLDKEIELRGYKNERDNRIST